MTQVQNTSDMKVNRAVESYSVADDAGLDDGLDQEVDDAVGDDDGDHQSWAAV